MHMKYHQIKKEKTFYYKSCRKEISFIWIEENKGIDYKVPRVLVKKKEKKKQESTGSKVND